MSLSPAFADVLAAGRPQFNRRIVEARHRLAAFDTAAFARFLQEAVDPLVIAIAARAPTRVAAVVMVAYDLAIELVGQGLAGPAARSRAVTWAWQELAPAYWRPIADQPLQALGALTNAVVNVERFVDPSPWIATMLLGAPRIETLDHLRRLGQVAAWRAGLAHFRHGALQAADRLPEALALTAVGAKSDAHWADVRAQFEGDAWWTPAEPAAKERAIEIGAFTGFGGTFPAPPDLRVSGEHFLVRSGDRHALLVVDGFGAVLHPASAAEFDAATIAAPGIFVQGKRLQIGYRTVEVDLPVDGLKVSATAHSVAVFSPYSFAVRLLPRQ